MRIMACLPVIVDDLHFVRSIRSPDKADSELVVDPDAVLPLSISGEALKSVAGRHTKLVQGFNRVQTLQLALGY
jgi:hypothetical protein